MNITELFDLLQSTHSFWMEISDELLGAGYVWEYSAHDDCYWLLDLENSNYFD
jgi:hypothetical protein